MASAADVLNRTDIFAPQQAITSSATTQWTDVFARRERRATPIMVPTRLSVRLFVSGKTLEFVYTTFDGGLPKWAGSVLQSLAERWGALPGWDSYQATPTNPRLVAKLLNILSDLMQDDSGSPQITPLADGGVQAEWHHHGKDLEIVVPAEGEPTYYYFDDATSAEEENDLDPNYASVQGLIGRFR